MKPRRTHYSNQVYTLAGGNEDNHLWVQQTADSNGNQVLCSVWELTEEERKQIINGSNIELVVWGSDHPPVSLHISNDPLGKRHEQI